MKLLSLLSTYPVYFQKLFLPIAVQHKNIITGTKPVKYFPSGIKRRYSDFYNVIKQLIIFLV
ncbi:MAG TPA: hypothetical protein VK369_06565, partial [Segetibacter sp.]|nr:hypothetical protein [Segetibacter sp.]